MLSSPTPGPHVVAPTGKGRAQPRPAGSTAQGGHGSAEVPQALAHTPHTPVPLEFGECTCRGPAGAEASVGHGGTHHRASQARRGGPPSEPAPRHSPERGHGWKQHPRHHPSLRRRAHPGPELLQQTALPFGGQKSKLGIQTGSPWAQIEGPAETPSGGSEGESVSAFSGSQKPPSSLAFPPPPSEAAMVGGVFAASLL